MYALHMQFKSNDAHHILILTNAARDPHGMSTDIEFALTADSNEAHVFYCYEDLLEVMSDITRVVNRRGIPGEEFDENMEHTKEVARTIRSYLNMRGSRFSIEFDVCEIKAQSMGKVAFALRSDTLR